MASDGTPAPYGGACENCSKVKCRCILRPEGACQRCHRLNKICRPSAPGRRIARKPTLAARPDQLQQKLDEFAVLLRASGHDEFANDVITAFQQRISKSFHPALPSRPRGVAPPSGCSSLTPLASSPLRRTDDNTTTSNSSRDALLPSPEPSAEESEIMFQSFCSGNLRFFPFVYFAPGTTAADIRRDRPFLWANIMMIKQKTLTYQRACSQHVREALARKLILDHERSMDLLMGLMAYIGWAIHQHGPKPFFCLYGQMMTALVGDLGLHRRHFDWHNPVLRWRQKMVPATVDKVSESYQTPDRPRIMLAAYLITSSAPSFNQKLEPMRWSSQMDTFLQSLEEAPECRNDKILVALVRMQLVADAAVRGTWNAEESITINHDSPTDMGRLQTPPVMMMKMLRDKLQRIGQDIGPEIFCEPSVVGHYHTVELAIFEILVSPMHLRSSLRCVPDVPRLDLLWSCLQAVKASLDVFIRYTTEDMISFSIMTATQQTQAFIMLYRLSVLDDPVWDREAARTAVDLERVLEEIADKYATVPVEVGIVSDATGGDMLSGDMYTRASRMIRSMRAFWGKEIHDVLRSKASQGPAGQADEVRLDDPALSMDLEFMDLAMESAWFSEFVMPPLPPELSTLGEGQTTSLGEMRSA